MQRNVEVRSFVWFGATLAVVLTLAACGRDGYVVVREVKTPHRAFDLPAFSGKSAERPAPPLPIVPIAPVQIGPVPPLVPNGLPLVPLRAAKAGAGEGSLSVTFSDRTGDRTSTFPEGSVKDCALFKVPGEAAGQHVLLYAHLASEARELRVALDMIL